LKIRKKITLVYSLIVGGILVLSSFYVYSLSSNYSLQLFYTRLKERAFIAANIYFEKDELSPKLYENIQKQFLHSLNKEDVVIYDSANRLITNDSKPLMSFSGSQVSKIREEKYLEFKAGDRQCVGIFYQDNQGNFVIIASAVDDLGIENVNHLKKILLLNFFLTIGVVVVTGRIVSNQLLNPVREIIQKVKKISATNLHLRLTERESKDELSELGSTFNQMLSRLEKVFESQKQFIHYASHELKTPLTTIMGKVEVVLNKSRSEEEYKKVLNVILAEAERLNKLTNGLFSLSKVNAEESSLMNEVVETNLLVKDVIADVGKLYENSRIDFSVSEENGEEKSFRVKGNQSLLYSAFYNIIENAVKFSNPEPVGVELRKTKGELIVLVTDKGIGIHREDFENIFKPFYRLQNALNYPGSGLGLSIAEQIVLKHRGTIRLHSTPGQGAQFEIRFVNNF